MRQHDKNKEIDWRLGVWAVVVAGMVGAGRGEVLTQRRGGAERVGEAGEVQPGGGDAADLVAVEKRAGDKGLSLREREQAADRAVEVRRRLIGGAEAEDPRLTGWLIDQSAALLARLGRDGSDSAVLFGIALPAQRAAVMSAAGEAVQGLERAGVRVDEASRKLSEVGIGADDPRAEAVEQDRTVRVPFFLARAEVLLAASTSGAERTRHAEAAHAAVSKLALASAGPEAARRVSMGAALLYRKSPADEGDAQVALDEFAGAVRSGGSVAAITLAEAWAGLVHAGAAAGRLDQTMKAVELALKQAPFMTGAKADPLLAVLMADATTRAMWEQGVRVRDRVMLFRAVAAQTKLLERTDLGMRADSLRPLAFEKLVLLAQGAGDDVPPAVRLARGIALARDPRAKEEAGKAFKDVAGSPDAGEYAADAMWEWAVLLSQGAAPDRTGAAEVLTRLAREWPKSVHAEDAMKAALAYGRAAVLEGGAGVLQRRVYEAALATATEHYAGLGDIELWRYERARLLSEPEGGGVAVDADADLALKLLDGVGAGSAVARDADKLRERIVGGVLDRGFARVIEMRKAGDEAGVREIAVTRLLPMARKMQGAKAAARFKLDLADAMVEAGQSGAAGIYKELAAQESELPGGAIRVRLGWARALILEGDRAGAFGHLREVATRLDAGEGSIRAREFWFAWTLMLELLQEENQDQKRSGTIRANIKRLEGIDGEFGGEPWKARIVKVREAVEE